MQADEHESALRSQESRRFITAKVPKRAWKAPIIRGSYFVGAVSLIVVVAVAALVWVNTRPPERYGTLLATVTLPGNGGCSVGGTFTGTDYVTVKSGCFSDTLQVYRPPVGSGSATLVSTIKMYDPDTGKPVNVSAVAWDTKRQMLWGAMANAVYLIDPNEGSRAPTSFQFRPGVQGSYLVDGLAYDSSDDSLYYAPDSNPNIYHFSLGTDGRPLGALLNTVRPKDRNVNAESDVSGVVVGSEDTLYIGRNKGSGARIVRIHKKSGKFVSDFATTFERVEDLACDATSHVWKGVEAILAKDAFNGLYEAFEVEAGTCAPLDGVDER